MHKQHMQHCIQKQEAEEKCMPMPSLREVLSMKTATKETTSLTTQEDVVASITSSDYISTLGELSAFETRDPPIISLPALKPVYKRLTIIKM